MHTQLTRQRSPFLAWLGVTVFSLLMVACGGGGGGASSPSTSGGGGSSAGTAAATLSGVAAYGAPLIGATVSAIDANGTSLGSTLASLVNGQYQLPVTSAKFPVLVQAVGSDMSGNPVVLHSVVLSPASNVSAQTTAHVTPLTNAVVALLMGGDPRTRFLAPSTISAATWSALGSSTAVAAANAFLLTAINANLAAAKPTALNKATLNIFSDATFNADKTGLDAVIDGVRVQFGKDVNGNELLKLSNRLILAGSSEVTVNLSATKSTLSTAIPTVASSAITSSRTTTSTATAITHVADLSTLQSTINDALAHPGVSATTFNPDSLARAPIVSASYNYFNGLDWSSLINQLVGFGTAGYQLSPFQVIGCLDDPVPSSGCTKVRIASLLRSTSTGQVMQVFENVVSWASGAGWTFVGNDAASALYLYPVTWQQWTAAGVASGSPGQGLQVDLNSLSPLLGNPRLGLPNPNSSARTMYPTSSGVGAVLLSSVATGDLLSDQVLAVSQAGPLSAADVTAGAQYRLTATALVPYPASSSGQFIVDKVFPTRLTADLPTNLASSLYPKPDGLSTTALSITDFIGGLNLNWSAWAAANPHLRMVEVRAVITSTASAPVSQVVQLPPMSATQLTLSSFTVPSDAVQYTLWLIAQDDQGRRYISKIIAA